MSGSGSTLRVLTGLKVTYGSFPRPRSVAVPSTTPCMDAPTDCCAVPGSGSGDTTPVSVPCCTPTIPTTLYIQFGTSGDPYCPCVANVSTTMTFNGVDEWVSEPITGCNACTLRIVLNCGDGLEVFGGWQLRTEAEGLGGTNNIQITAYDCGPPFVIEAAFVSIGTSICCNGTTGVLFTITD